MENISEDLKNVIKDYIIFRPKIKKELEEAVDLWYSNREKAYNRYGHISNWDTSLITDMSRLFQDYSYFNDKINNWDVSSVTNMRCMFFGAISFNLRLD